MSTEFLSKKTIKELLKQKYVPILTKLGARRTNEYTFVLDDRIFYVTTNKTYKRIGGLSDLQPIDKFLEKKYKIKILDK